MSKKPSVAGGFPDSCLAFSFVESGAGERGKERALVYQGKRQKAPTFSSNEGLDKLILY
jgi:hypothetical protein